MAGPVTPGRNVTGRREAEMMKPGDYRFVPPTSTAPSGGLMAWVPNTAGPRLLAFDRWQWDGNLERPTLDPSIKVRGSRAGVPEQLWHGRLSSGDWHPA